MPAALAIRDVRLLVTAVGLSAVGDFLVWVPLALHVEATTGSAFAVAAFFFALFGPSVALAGFAGRLADRVENAQLNCSRSTFARDWWSGGAVPAFSTRRASPKA